MKLRTTVLKQAIRVAVLFLALGNVPRVFAQCHDGLPLEAYVFLGGVFDNNTGMMHDSLRVHGSIPLTEPYTALGYVHVGGGGEVAPLSLMEVMGPDAIVDWVVVELRHPNNPGKRVATQSALLQRSGRIIAATGQSLGFCVPSGQYQVVVRHRNHLGVITASSVLLAAQPALLDMRFSEARLRGGIAAQMPLDPDSTVWALWPGDVSFDGRVQYVGEGNDRDPILQAIGGTVPTNVQSEVYMQPDVNMDSRVQYVGMNNDRDPLLVAIGGAVPTNVREDFIPEDTLRLRPNVHFVDSTVWVLDTTLTDMEAFTVAVFDIQGPMPQLAEGHTIVSNANGGFIIQVASAEVNGNTLTVNGALGWLDAVYESGTVVFEAALNSDAAQSAFGPLQVTPPDGLGFSGGLLDLGVSVDFGMYWETTLTPAGISRTHVGFSGGASANGRFQLSGSVSVPFVSFPSVPLGRLPLAVVLPLPPPAFAYVMPIPAVFTLENSISGSLGAQLPVSDYLWNYQSNVRRMGVTFDEIDGIGTEYASTPSNVSVEPAATITPATISASVSWDMALKAQIFVHGLPVGPYVSMGVGHNLAFANTAEAWQVEYSAPLKFSIGFGAASFFPDQIASYSYDFNPITLYSIKVPGAITLLTDSNVVGTVNETITEDKISAQATASISILSAPHVSVPFAIPGVPVKFQVATGGGSVPSMIVDTDASGIARTAWTLGPGELVGITQKLNVVAKDGAGAHLVNSPLHVTALTSYELVITAGDDQAGYDLMQLELPLEVRVQTPAPSHLPVAGVTVAFSVYSGGGSIDQLSVVTDSDGRASVLWTLGSESLVEQLVSARVLDGAANDIPGSPAVFGAGFVPVQMEIVSGTGQRSFAGQMLAAPIVIKLVRGTVPVPGKSVYFSTPHPGGVITPSTMVTGTDGTVSVQWQLADLHGRQRMSASATNIDGSEIYPGPVDIIAFACDGCPSTVQDQQGNSYGVVNIGCHCWTDENLRVTEFKNGDPIALGTDSAGWMIPFNEPRRAAKFFDAGNVNTYGWLYNRAAVTDPRGICPNNWGVPSDLEWMDLIDAAGGMNLAGNAIRGTPALWSTPDPVTGAEHLNTVGFNGLPGLALPTWTGPQSEVSGFDGNWWSSGGGYLWTFYDLKGVDLSTTTDAQSAYSTRCVFSPPILE